MKSIKDKVMLLRTPHHTYAIIGIFLLCLLMNVALTYSSPVSVTLNFPKDVIYPGEVTEGYVTITNNLNTSITIYVDFYAEGYETYITRDIYRITLSPQQKIKEKVFFYAPYDAKNQPYDIYVYVKENNKKGRVLGENKHIIYVRKSPTLKITSLSLATHTLNPGEKQHVFFTVRNVGTLQGENYTARITIKRGEETRKMKKIKIPNLKPKEKFSHEEEFSFDKYEDKGTYVVVLEILDEYEDVVDRNITYFSIKAVPLFKESETSKNYFLSKRVIVSVRNEGNEVGSKKIKILAAGWDITYDFVNITPTIEHINGKEYFTYTCVLKPKEECKIEYKINYWMYYLSLIIAILILILLFMQFSTPTISKKYFKKGHRYKVILEINNRSNKEIHDVKVVDSIPGIVNIEEKGFMPKPTSIKRKKDRYEVSWNLGNMKPKEVRIISYEVIPKISLIGDIELHHVEMHAKTHKGNDIKAKSKAKKHTPA